MYESHVTDLPDMRLPILCAVVPVEYPPTLVRLHVPDFLQFPESPGHHRGLRRWRGALGAFVSGLEALGAACRSRGLVPYPSLQGSQVEKKA